MLLIVLLVTGGILAALMMAVLFKQSQLSANVSRMDVRLDERADQWIALRDKVQECIQAINTQHLVLEQKLEAMQFKHYRILQESIQTNLTQFRQELLQTLHKHIESMMNRIDKLTQATDQRLKEISGQVEKRLTEGFDKTTATLKKVMI